MARDKAKDDRLFNCSQHSEHDYVAGLYDATQRPSVRTLLTNGCANNTIYHSTHLQIYTLIKDKLGYAIPS
jgi:hypothetical protein